MNFLPKNYKTPTKTPEKQKEDRDWYIINKMRQNDKVKLASWLDHKLGYGVSDYNENDYRD